jgi:hypothetical protein
MTFDLYCISIFCLCDTMCLCDLCPVACTFVKTPWTSSISSVHVEPMNGSDECLINFITLRLGLAQYIL